jgi:hypothetical protein
MPSVRCRLRSAPTIVGGVSEVGDRNPGGARNVTEKHSTHDVPRPRTLGYFSAGLTTAPRAYERSRPCLRESSRRLASWRATIFAPALPTFPGRAPACRWSISHPDCGPPSSSARAPAPARRGSEGTEGNVAVRRLHGNPGEHSLHRRRLFRLLKRSPRQLLALAGGKLEQMAAFLREFDKLVFLYRRTRSRRRSRAPLRK